MDEENNEQPAATACVGCGAAISSGTLCKECARPDWDQGV